VYVAEKAQGIGRRFEEIGKARTCNCGPAADVLTNAEGVWLYKEGRDDEESVLGQGA
jgi:hypothetical protein